MTIKPDLRYAIGDKREIKSCLKQLGVGFWDRLLVIDSFMGKLDNIQKYVGVGGETGAAYAAWDKLVQELTI